MLVAEVVALVVACHAVVILVTGSYGEHDLVAVGMSSHIGPDICLVVVQENRPGVMIVGREVVPVPRRHPDYVSASSEDLEDGRSGVECGPDDIARAVDVRSTYDLEVVIVCALGLGDQSCDVLEDVICKHCLDQEEVVVSVDGLQHAEIVDVTVAVEVEVGHGILTVVEHRLEFLDGACLCEEGGDSLEVELERYVFVLGVDLGDRGGRAGLIRRYGRAVVGGSRNGIVGDDPGGAAGRQEKRH